MKEIRKREAVLSYLENNIGTNYLFKYYINIRNKLFFNNKLNIFTFESLVINWGEDGKERIFIYNYK